MAEILILVISLVTSACIGVFVYARNPHHIVNRLYALLASAFTLFSLANYLSLNTSYRLWFIRATVFFTSIALATLYYLIVYLGNENAKLSKLQRLALYETYALLVLIPTPLVFNGLSAGSNPAPTPQLGAALFLFHFLAFPIASIALLTRKIRHTIAAQRVQFTYLFMGLLPVVLLAPVTSFIMPVLFKNVSLVFLSPIYVVFFVSMIGYAIAKHKLFDLRSAVFRGVTYVFTTLVLSLLYVVPTVYILGIVIMGFPFNLGKFAIAIVFGTIAATNYEKARSWFDAHTAKIFYRDRYDAGRVLSDLNKGLVSSVSLQKVLHDSSALIIENIKSDFCIFVLPNTEGTGYRTMGLGKEKLPSSSLAVLYENHKWPSNVMATDDLSGESKRLKSVLSSNDVAVVVRLTENSRHDGAFGYILLGFKKSGNLYTSQDMHTLDAMADALVIAIQNGLRFEEIQKFNATLQDRITEATAQLRRTNAKLKALDETKDDFISMASHQLRTPLTSVKGYLSMVLEGDAGKITPMQRKMLDQAFVSSQRMVFLIADLLNVSRLKTGKFVIEPSWVNLAKTVEDEVAQLKETAKNRSLELVYDKPADFPTLMFDETKIRQVIMNFIDNAIYYTPAGGTIRVQLTDKPSTVELRVIDNGIGVPKREQPHLFTKFYRAGNARQARPDGTGLGLFMAKKVIVAQGGAIIFETVEGKGSTFGFVFPKSKLMAPPAQPAQVVHG